MDNKRRVELIDKRLRGPLSEEELAELRRLQEEASRLANANHPLPVETLESMEALAKRLEGKP